MTKIKIKNNTYLASLEHISVIIRKYNNQPVFSFAIVTNEVTLGNKLIA